MQLQPLEKKAISAGARYLNIFSATHAFLVSNPNEQLTATTVKSGFSYDVQAYTTLWIENPSDTEVLNVELEIGNLQVLSGGSSAVEIANNPTIQRIIEPIAVTAEATVENGTVHVISGASFAEQPDKTINAGTKQLLLAENLNRKKAIIQIISATRTDIRFGGVTVAAGRGIYAAGSKTSPAHVEIETGAAIYAHNEDGANQALITITEVNK